MHKNILLKYQNMKIERTLSIIKPDAVYNNKIGKIYSEFENFGLKIIASKMTKLSLNDAKIFYNEHSSKPFFENLIKFMISGPIQVQVLEGKNAILKHRKLIGNTDPKKAKKNTIRFNFAKNIESNAVHGSSNSHAARIEIAFFFPECNIYSSKIK